MSTAKVQTRQPLNTRQRNILTEFYRRNPYPTASERQQLSRTTGRTMKQVQDWFSNRRRNDPRLVSTSVSTPNVVNVNTSPQPYLFEPTTSVPVYYDHSFNQHSPTGASVCSCCYYGHYSSTYSTESMVYPVDTSLSYSTTDSVQSQMFY